METDMTSTQVVDPQPMVGPQVWDRDTFQDSAAWVWPLAAAEVAELLEATRRARAAGLQPTVFGKDDFPTPLLDARLAAVRTELEEGKGFVVLRGLPVADLALDDARVLFWGLSLTLGHPEAQDGAGHRLHSVTNTGLKVDPSNSVRSYQTDDELTFHNDGGDAFMLLCLRTAKSGGVSRLISAATIYNQVLRQRPDLLPLLFEPWDFDTRGQHPMGLEIQPIPILNFFAGKLSVLYKRRYLLLAQGKPTVRRWSPAQAEAIELIESICREPANRLEVSMQAGDIQIGNNYAVLHARTSYQDHDSPDQRRHLLRGWMTLPNGRPLPPVFALSREFGPSYQRRMMGKTHLPVAGQET